MPSGATRAAWLFWILALLTARAHQPGLSTLFVDLHPDRVAADLIVAWRELDPVFTLDREDVIRIPSTIVEPLIAASIVYVGVENIVRENYRWRWALTFVFGLVHGCGFATILRDLGIGTHGGGVAGPLVSFNLGVELGQLAIAGLMLPVIWKLKPRFAARWLPATSLVAILLGSYWLIERTFL